MDRNEVLRNLLFQCVREYADQTGRALAIDLETPLLGPSAEVDSLGLVMIVTSFEDKLNEHFDAQLVLANEKAMSMKRSPFRSVQALSEYAAELLDE
jgi:acyl carrier protein